MQEIDPKTVLAQDRYVHVKRPRASQRYEAEKSKSAPYPQGQRDGLFNYDTIHGMKLTRMQYTVPTQEERRKMRKAFDGNWKQGVEGERAKFLKWLANTQEKELVDKLGLTKTDINRMKRGIGVKGFNVHHKLPIHGGGTNDFSNLILEPIFPHDQLHQDVMNPQISGMKEGDTRSILVPYSTDNIYNPQEFGCKLNGKAVEPCYPTRIDESLPYYAIKNYRPEHIGVDKRQKYMQSTYDEDRKKAQQYANKGNNAGNKSGGKNYGGKNAGKGSKKPVRRLDVMLAVRAASGR